MSDGKEQYADNAFNKAAEAAMDAYKKKATGLPQIADNMAALGAEMGMLAGRFAEAPPRNQYEPLFPSGAAIGSPPRPFGGTLTGAGTGGGALGLPPTREEMESVLRKTGWKYPEHTLNAITNPLQKQKRQERDPNGVDPHTPGAKLDAGKTPLATQVGGGHYKKMKIQPVEYVHANGIGYFEGNVIKYVSRWREKGGVADLEKAKHYIDLLLELEKRI